MRPGRARCRRCALAGLAGETESGFTLVEVLVAFALVSLATLMAFRISAETAQRSRQIAIADTRIDEAESIVMLRAALGTLHAGIEQGRFSDGQPWTLSVADIGPALGWRNLPPLWRVRLNADGPDGRPVYVTLIAGGLGGG